MAEGAATLISDEELRLNHDFVMSFESLRKRYGVREMDSGSLEAISRASGIPYQTLRTCRHLRNALAHGDPVNRDTLATYYALLTAGTEQRPAPVVRRLPVDRSDGVKAYRVHAWQDESLEAEMLANGFVSVGDDELGDVGGVTDIEQVRSMLVAAFPDRAGAIGIFAGYWRRFLFDAAAGDLIVLPTRTRGVAIGEFVGSYHYVADARVRARHRRAVSWDATDLDRDAFGNDLQNVLSGRHTIQDIKVPDAASRLRSIANTGIDPG
jgi:hypothetical protein